MSKTKIRVDAVPEGVQAIVAQAKADLVDRTRLNPEIISVTKLERIERLDTEDERSIYVGFGKDALPDYRIFFLAKGTQYVYETRGGKSPKLTEEKFVV
ncbi:MAG: hypothetical protein ACE5LU_00835 [Anaerolineae bacterium]